MNDYKTDFKELLSREIYPIIANNMDDVLPEFDFTLKGSKWVSRNTLHLSGSEGKDGKGKVTISKNKPYSVGDFREGVKSIISYLIESNLHPSIPDYKTAVFYLAAKANITIDGNDNLTFERGTPKPPPPPRETDYISPNIVTATLREYSENCFTHYLVVLFGNEISDALISRFAIGTSKRWKGANIFWQIDTNGKPRQAKIMLYNPITGKRLKEQDAPDKGRVKVDIAGKSILKKEGNPNPNLIQCFFGENQLEAEPTKTVCLVESEKTAILMTVIFPENLWLATGGKSGCGWTNESVFSVLKSRRVILCPDLGCFDDWSKKAEYLNSINFNVSCSSVLKKLTTEKEKTNGYDLADYYIKQHNITGYALDEKGNPYVLRDDITKLIKHPFSFPIKKRTPRITRNYPDWINNCHK